VRVQRREARPGDQKRHGEQRHRRPSNPAEHTGIMAMLFSWRQMTDSRSITTSPQRSRRPGSGRRASWRLCASTCPPSRRRPASALPSSLRECRRRALRW
jgi:hypothetical protein